MAIDLDAKSVHKNVFSIIAVAGAAQWRSTVTLCSHVGIQERLFSSQLAAMQVGKGSHYHCMHACHLENREIEKRD